MPQISSTHRISTQFTCTRGTPKPGSDGRSPIARYFFDSGDSNHVVEDDVGIDCTGLEEARRAGLEGLKDLARDALKDSDEQLLFVEVR
jgi:hypothetical protein